jgi:hypothetical protein
MFSFLRKLRLKIITENKFLKYLKYAVGEIILVVIGILIAVAINSKYNEAQDKRKIKSILFQIQRELLTDIEDSKRIYNEYIAKDSIYRMIMNDTSLTYLHKQSPFSFRINTRYVSFSNKKGGYNRLLNNIEVIPEEYNFLISKLNFLHVELQNDIDDYNEMIKNSVLNYFEEENKTKPNFSQLLWENDAKKTLSYYENDAFFKNKVTSYINALRNIQQVANDYRIESIDVYNAIDSLTGNTSSEDISILNTTTPEMLIKDYLGEYSDGQDLVSLKLKGKDLMLNDIKLFWHENNYYYNRNSFNIIKLYRNANEFFIKTSNTNTVKLYKKTIH